MALDPPFELLDASSHLLKEGVTVVRSVGNMILKVFFLFIQISKLLYSGAPLERTR